MLAPMSEPTPASEPLPLKLPQSLRELFAMRLDWTARYGLFVAALTAVGTVVGSALSPYLLVSHPLILVLMSPIPRHMLLVAPSVDLPSYLLVGVARRMLATSGAVCLGLRFGEAGIAWVENHDDRFRRGARWLRVAFRRAGLLVVFVSPNPFVTATAVAIGAPLRAVMVVACLGHVMWLLIWHRFGDLFSAWIAPITDFFQRYTWQSTAVCVVGVAVYYALRLTRRSAE